jgi:hypothetical protein
MTDRTGSPPTEVKVGAYTIGMVRDCLDYLVASKTGPYKDAEDALRGLPTWDEYGNHETPLYALCWQQEPDGLTACDRMRGHGGEHSWANHGSPA